MKRRTANVILSAIISFGLLFWIFFSFEPYIVVAAIREAKPIEIGVGFLFIVAAYLIRPFRWRIWQSNLTFQEAFELIMIGSMGNNLFPMRLGEFIRAYCTAYRTGEGYGGTAALGSVIIERILDGLVISVIAILGIILVPIQKNLFNLLLIISSFFIFLTIAMLSLVSFDKSGRKLLIKLRSIFPGHLTRLGIEKVFFFLDGLILIRSIRKILFALIISTVVWGLELIGYALIAWSIWPEFTFEVSLIYLPIVKFVSLFPYAIGGIGAVEGAVTYYLSSVGIPGNIALAMVLSQHGFQYCFTVLCGASLYFLRDYSGLPNAKRPESGGGKPISIDLDISRKIQDFSEEFSVELKPEKSIAVSIIIPSYNEQHRMPKTVLETMAWFTSSSYDYEIIIVDDGSIDDTLQIASLFSRQFPNIRCIACPHEGKGAAVKMGMLNASGEYVLFMDADGATPLDQIQKILSPIQNGKDIAIGSRVIQYPGETCVTTSYYRRIIGRIFAGVVNILTMPGIGDTQCGFKAFKKGVIRPIFTRQRIKGFAFDVEILFIARKLGLSIAEIPINWVNQPGSKVNILTDSLKMLIDALRIKWYHRNMAWHNPYLPVNDNNGLDHRFGR